VPILARGDDVAFVPPLQLSKADAAEPGNFGAVESLRLWR
jgi:hypothetical protein